MLAGLVAVAYVGLAWADGGFYPRLYAAATVAVWWLVVVTLILRLRPRAPVAREAVIAGACLAALAGLAALSLAWSDDDGRTFAEAVRMAGYLGLFVLVVVVSAPGSARAWLGGIAVGLAGLAAIALVSRLQPSFTAEDAELVAALPSAAGRLSWPLSYWNGIAACMALGIVLCAWFGARGEDRRVRALAAGSVPLLVLTLYFTSSRGGVVALAVGLIAAFALDSARARLAAVLCVSGVGAGLLIAIASRNDDLVDGLETGSAAAAGDLVTVLAIVVCAGVAAAVYLADARLAALRIPRPGRRATLVGVGVTLVVLVAALVAVDPVQQVDEFTSPPAGGELAGVAGGSFDRGGGDGRWQLWGEAVDGFASQPAYGLGAGEFATYWNRNATISFITSDAHSLYLETAAELGIAGILALGGFLAAVAAAAVRHRRSGAGPELAVATALALTGATSAAFDWTRELPATFVPLIIATALICGSATLRPLSATARAWSVERPRAVGFGGRSSGLGLGLGVLAIAAASLWAGGVLFLTEQNLAQAQSEVVEGDLTQAADDAHSATTLEPWAAEPRLTEALVAEANGDLDRARELLGEALERAPDDWELWIAVSRVEQKRGDDEAAGDAYERAHELNPRSPLFGLPAGSVPGAPGPADSGQGGGG
jgi:hypothetical protein